MNNIGLVRTNEKFAQLELNEYLCEYTDRSDGCAYAVPTQEELNAVYQDMGKNTAESRRINCSCCGYETYELMATAIQKVSLIEALHSLICTRGRFH